MGRKPHVHINLKIQVKVKTKANLIGQTFGRLTVVSSAPTRPKGKSMWNCVCSCGGLCVTDITKLRSGHTQSCGCYFKERTRAPRDFSIIGQKFGFLTVLGRDDALDGRKRHLWVCQCDCGKQTLAAKHGLQNGRWVSCGCKHSERTIARNTTHGLSKTREYRIAKDAKRRKFINASTDHFSAEDVQNILAMQQFKCPVCRKKLGAKYDVDHITPLIRGGKNDKLNIQILHSTCNRKKSGKDPVEFMRQNGFLL